MTASDPPRRAAFVESDDDQKSIYGDGDDVSVAFDPSVGTDGAMVVRDEINDNDAFEVRVGATNTVVAGGDMTVEGTTTEVDDIITDKVVVEDADGNNEYVLNGGSNPPVATFASHLEFTENGTPAQSGTVRLANDEWVAARNGADDGDVQMWKVNTNDAIEPGERVVATDTTVTTAGLSDLRDPRM